jgi:hypothetical protein
MLHVHYSIHIKELTTVAVKTRESTVPTPAHNEEDVEVDADAVEFPSLESNSPGCTTPSPFVSRVEIIAMCSSSVLLPILATSEWWMWPLPSTSKQSKYERICLSLGFQSSRDTHRAFLARIRGLQTKLYLQKY